MAKTGREALAALIDDGGPRGDRLAVAGWGLTAVVAFVLGFASWQYAEPRPVATEIARSESLLPDPGDITGSVGASPRSGRVIAAERITPVPLAGNETVATSRDIDQLRAEIKEIQRRIGQIGLAGDGVTRRIDRIEERIAGDPAGARNQLSALLPPAPDRPAEKTDRLADRAETADKTADRIPLPARRPEAVADAAPKAAAAEAEGPVVTGSVTRSHRAITQPGGQPSGIPVAEAPMVDPVRPAARASEPPPPTVTGAPPIQIVPTQVASAAPAAVAPPAANPPPPTPATTGSVPSAEPAGLDLGGFRSVAGLKRAWSDLSGRYADLGKGIEPLARLRETDTGMEARLLAGPFASQTEAAKACLRLKAAGVGCSVTGYGGQSLTATR